jgi:hypothetical protein
MSKKSIDRKAAKQFVLDNRNDGKTDQEIYNELTQQYYDKKGIALLIAGTVTNNRKTKYRQYNNILLVLIGLTILDNIFAVLSLSLAEKQLWILLLVFIAPLLNIFFFYEIARYNAPIYRAVGLLTIAGFLQSMSKAENGNYIFINIIWCSGVAGLAFFLQSKMFPYFSPKKLQKDLNGEYILAS